MIDRFTLYVSQPAAEGCLSTGPPALAAGEWVIYAGHAHGLTFASQISKVETLRSEFTFGTLLRGLQVYGFKVHRRHRDLRGHHHRAGPDLGRPPERMRASYSPE